MVFGLPHDMCPPSEHPEVDRMIDEVTNSADRELMAGAFFAFNCLMPLGRPVGRLGKTGNTGRPHPKNCDCKMVYGRHNSDWALLLLLSLVLKADHLSAD